MATLERAGVEVDLNIDVGQDFSQSQNITLPPSDVASITRAINTATVTTENDHCLSTGDYVLLSGSDQCEYNGLFQVTVTAVTTFTMNVANEPTSPSTGKMVMRACVDITNYVPRLSIKESPGSTDEILALTEGAGLTITGATGQIDIEITSEQTASSLDAQEYTYDLKLTSPAGNSEFPMFGTLQIHQTNNG